MCIFENMINTFLKKNKVYNDIKNKTGKLYLNFSLKKGIAKGGRKKKVFDYERPNCPICLGGNVNKNKNYGNYRHWRCIDCQKYFKEEIVAKSEN